MRTLDQLDFSAVAAQSAVASRGWTAASLRAALPVVRLLVWAWFFENQDERIKVSLWIFRPSVRVAALRPYLETVLGPPPAILPAVDVLPLDDDGDTVLGV